MKKYKKRMKNKITNKPNQVKKSIQQNPNLAKAQITFRWLIMILIGAILFVFFAIIVKVFAKENEQVRVGKEILAEIQNNQKRDTDIKVKDFQKPLNNNMANWTRNLENKLNEDAKNIKPIIEPEIKTTQEHQDLANDLIERSQGIINESLGVADEYRESNQSATDFLIFASFSIGEKNLENLIKLATSYNGAVILRGFKNSSFKETAAFLSKFSQEKEGILIDPNLFLEYGVTKVPTFVLTKPCEQGLQANCKKVFDKLTGMVSPSYALQKFSEKGELKEFAKERLGR